MEHRRDLPPMPPRIARLPVDHRGFPVPWFVAWIDGVADFRVIAPGKVTEAHNKHRCWICGDPLGAFKAFTIGPMCAVNRISAEPPSHRECAEFSVRACPFLTRPRMRRNEKDLPEEAQDPAGIMLARNPGVALVWVTRDYRLVRDGRRGVLFQVGEPTECLWFAEGRPATRAEVMASVKSGLPNLRRLAEQEGPPALHALDRQLRRAQPIFDGVAA